jgi:hypothetical protein
VSSGGFVALAGKASATMQSKATKMLGRIAITNFNPATAESPMVMLGHGVTGNVAPVC